MHFVELQVVADVALVLEGQGLPHTFTHIRTGLRP